MTKMLLGCAVLALAAGCATAPPPKKTAVKVVQLNELDASKASPDNTYVCEESIKLGSNVKAPVCKSLRDREREREAAQNALRRLMQSGFDRR